MVFNTLHIFCFDLNTLDSRRQKKFITMIFFTVGFDYNVTFLNMVFQKVRQTRIFWFDDIVFAADKSINAFCLHAILSHVPCVTLQIQPKYSSLPNVWRKLYSKKVPLQLTPTIERRWLRLKPLLKKVLLLFNNDPTSRSRIISNEKHINVVGRFLSCATYIMVLFRGKEGIMF